MQAAKEILGWGGAGVVVAAAHVSIAYGVALLAPERQPAATEQAMIVELAPLVIAKTEQVATELIEAAESETVEEVDEPLPETETVEPEPVEEQAEPAAEAVETPPEEQPIEEVVRTPEVERPEVVAPRPVKPKPAKPVERKAEKRPKPEPEKKAKRHEKRKPAKQQSQAQASAKAEAGQAGSQARASNASPSRWYGQVQAAILRRKPRGNGSKGNVTVNFVVNSGGAIVSASISRSSGNPKLDQSALAMVRGARIPAPPAGLGRSSYPFVLPISFR